MDQTVEPVHNQCKKRSPSWVSDDYGISDTLGSEGDYIEGLSSTNHISKKRKQPSDDSDDSRLFTLVTDTTRDAYSNLLQFVTKLYVNQCSDSPTFKVINLSHVTEAEKPEICYSLPEGRSVTVTYKGEQIKCIRQKASKDHATSHDISFMYELRLSGPSKKILDELVLDACRTTETLKIYLYNTKNCCWIRHGNVQNRTAESLVLDKGVLDELFADIDQFVDAENDYAHFGHPYKRNYLFHGKPGTGKTSLVNVIANKLKRNIYIICFDPDLTDSGLMSAFRSINDQNAILLLEDIDCVFQNRNSNINKSNVSHSALYNALDGVSRVKGLITIVSTNYVETLDPALVRPGRIDMKLKFSTITQNQVSEMIKLYKLALEEKTVVDIFNVCKSKELTPSTLSGFLFRYRRAKFDQDPESQNYIVTLFKKYLQEMTPKKSENYKHMYV
ncbi:putative mitochondrial chaperone BCS1-B [Yasminevirus sp. GU-2018]|uniref:Putative mitochondrial chaperone BCS1-B n=1 Tax=Yasminevirus sp. GU-2018 TaxID=2420051 RepID=A0A5K0U7S7_9VIRU|nr:putative mitochondrial chaperone BCS1-B [Yasminevirus sp. GU-2018]